MSDYIAPSFAFRERDGLNSTWLSSCTGGVACLWTTSPELLHLILPAIGFGGFASVTLCIFSRVKNAIGDIAECAFKSLYCKTEVKRSPNLCESEQ